MWPFKKRPLYKTLFGWSHNRPICHAKGCDKTPVPSEGPFCEEHTWADV